MSRNCASSAAGCSWRSSVARRRFARSATAQSRANVSLNVRARGSRARRRRERVRVTTGEVAPTTTARRRVGRADETRRADRVAGAATRDVASTSWGSQRIWTRQPDANGQLFVEKPPSGMPSRTPRRADFDAMSLKVASTLAPRLAEHARRVSGATGLARRPRVYPGEIVIPIDLSREGVFGRGRGSLARRRAPPRRPRGGRSGDKAAAEALVAEVKPHLDGGFALASIAADGAASFYHRFSTNDAVVALEATELEPGWLERECALSVHMRVPIGTDNSAGVDAALARRGERVPAPRSASRSQRRGGDEGDEDDDTSAPPEKRNRRRGRRRQGRRVAKSPRVRAAAAAAADRTRVAAPARDRVAAGAGGRTDASRRRPPSTPPTPPRRTASFRRPSRAYLLGSSSLPRPRARVRVPTRRDGSRARMNVRSTSSDGSAFARIPTRTCLAPPLLSRTSRR